MIRTFDLFSVGIGPSSSHAVGPMRAARRFVLGLREDGLLPATAGVRAELFGSLGATGHGHGSDKAVLLGLAGEDPETVDTDLVEAVVAGIRESGRLPLLGVHPIALDLDRDVVLHRRRTLPFHPNGMIFSAYDETGRELAVRTYYSVGGGFVVDESATGADRIKPDATPVPYPFTTGVEPLGHTRATGLRISDVMLANELVRRPDEAELRARLLHIWQVMQDCVERGCIRDGVLPGGLKVRRRAADLRRRLEAEHFGSAESPFSGVDPLRIMDWVTLFALAVNEENAAGGRGRRPAHGLAR